MHEHINLYGRYDFTNPRATTHQPTPIPTNTLKPLHFVQIFQRPQKGPLAGGVVWSLAVVNRPGFPGDSISWEIMESWED